MENTYIPDTVDPGRLACQPDVPSGAPAPSPAGDMQSPSSTIDTEPGLPPLDPNDPNLHLPKQPALQPQPKSQIGPVLANPLPVDKNTFLYQEPVAQARIDLSRAGETIRHIIGDKRKRRALSKAMRDSFQWADETVSLYSDFNDNFYFTTESGFPSDGGLVLFENTIDGFKGLMYQVCT